MGAQVLKNGLNGGWLMGGGAAGSGAAKPRLLFTLTRSRAPRTSAYARAFQPIIAIIDITLHPPATAIQSGQYVGLGNGF